mmetsp:Transcript_122744/g.274018  ORF Transcript_122744/g.274018 Transcript_122744/m.274018 type:complete len:138 (+) Transcript_122744:112-525(+)
MARLTACLLFAVFIHAAARLHSDASRLESAIKHSRSVQNGKARKMKKYIGDDDNDEYEYGDREANARNADSSDFSVHQFLERDDGRDGSDNSGDADGGAAAEMARSKALAAEDKFDTEDTPDTSLIQRGKFLRTPKF